MYDYYSLFEKVQSYYYKDNSKQEMCGLLHHGIKQLKEQRCYKTSSVASREVTAINIKTNFPAVGYLWRSAICVTTVWFAGGHYYRVLPVYPGASQLLDYYLRASSTLLHRDEGQNIFISGCVKAILIPNDRIDCNEIVNQCFRTQYRYRFR